MKEKLNKFANNITSQHGEDGILNYIVGVLGERIVKVVCEVGAFDGIVASNTYHLWKECGWKAVLIEGERDKYEALLENVKGDDTVTVERFISKEGPDSIDSIFKEHSVAPKMGIMSIDIDSFDYHIWKGLNYVDPQIVVIEHNQKIPPHIDYFDPEGSVYLKCSAKALERLGMEKGYRLVCCTKSNSIFVKEEYFDSEKFPDMPVEYLFDYQELNSQFIFTGENGNRYPIFSKKTRTGLKVMLRIHYWFSAAIKKKLCFQGPPPEVREHIKKLGLDI